MGKRGVVLGALALLVVLAILGFLFINKSDAPSSDDFSPFPGGQKSSEGISAIKDALDGSKTVECRFMSSEGQRVIAYIKNGQIRADIRELKDEDSGSMIVKDLTMYFWNDTTAYKVEVSREEMDPGTPPPGSPRGPVRNLIQNFEKYKQFCNDAVIPDSLFALPSGVTFETLEN